ncbi:MAG: DJ-1/PfpI family protein [Campylobacterales bacterium]|nr:DJ-1/PfpI family protein [Campylobacterales bacterium]
MAKVKVLVPLAVGFEEIEAVAIIDVMRRAGISVVVSAVKEELIVQGANGIIIKADNHISQVDVDSLDMVVLPGGWGGTDILAVDETVQNILKTMNAQNKLIGAICAAPFALHSAGVLSQNYTCYPSVEEKIRTQGYTQDSKVVEDGNILTSRGPGTALCFGLAIVRKLCGEEIFLQLKAGLLADYCQ